MSDGRVIKVWIEMDMPEELFNPDDESMTDEEARQTAIDHFAEIVGEAGFNGAIGADWVQASIISPILLGCGCIEGAHPNTIEAMKKAHPDLIGWTQKDVDNDRRPSIV